MSQITQAEALVQKRMRYARPGKEHKGKIIDELVELFGYHRKAAIRALRPPPPASPFVRCHPREFTKRGSLSSDEVSFAQFVA